MDIQTIIETFSKATCFIEEIFAYANAGEKFFVTGKMDIELACEALNIEKFSLIGCGLGLALVLYQTFDLLNKLPIPESEYDNKLKRSYMAGAFTVAIKNICYLDHHFPVNQVISAVFKNNKKGLCTVEREFLKAIHYDIPMPRELTIRSEIVSPTASLVFAKTVSVSSQDTVGEDICCINKA